MKRPFARKIRQERRAGEPAWLGECGHPARRRGAFTLVEVVLAVGIAVGLLFVVLFFYRQAAALREQVLRETERISAIRLVMDQLTTDLRSTVAQGTPLVGDSYSIELIRTELPGRANWNGGELGRAAYPETDLRRIVYSLGDGLITFGLVRTEEALVGVREVPTEAVSMPEDTIASVPLPLTEEIQFVRFRFWDGADWVEEWISPSPPAAVEINLGSEPLPEDAVADDYPYELFQRVVCLPMGGHPEAEVMPALDVEVMAVEEMR